MGESKIIFTKGKELALKSLFTTTDTTTFPYLAIGYDDQSSFDNSAENGGFKEITDTTYKRIPLRAGTVEVDSTTNKVTVPFIADLEYTNITATTPINQLAVVDSGTANDPNTNFYAATTFPKFDKNELNAITFTIGFRF